MTEPAREEIIQKIKKRIEYHADEKKYGYFLGRDVIDYLAKDILRDLQIDELTARAERAEARLKEPVRDFYQYAQGGTEICAYCLHDNECEPGETMCGATFKAFRWRGMREGEE